MSGTSSEARTASSGGGGFSGFEHAELVERAGHGTHRSGRDFRVESGVLKLCVPEQDLDDADVVRLGPPSPYPRPPSPSAAIKIAPLPRSGFVPRPNPDGPEARGP